VSFVVPSLLWAEFSHPELTATAITVILAGIGSGIALLYHNLKVGKAKADAEATVQRARADAEAYKIIEEARKGTTLAALDGLTHQMTELKAALDAARAENARLEAGIETAERRHEVERLKDVMDFALQVLREKEFAAPEGGPPHDEPPVPPGPDRRG
jgi:cell division septum initiation protein DivIVA